MSLLSLTEPSGVRLGEVRTHSRGGRDAQRSSQSRCTCVPKTGQTGTGSAGCPRRRALMSWGFFEYQSATTGVLLMMIVGMVDGKSARCTVSEDGDKKSSFHFVQFE